MLKIGFVSMLFAGIFVVGCAKIEQAPLEDKVGNVLSGDHRLRKMSEKVETKSSVSGGFFLFVGAMNGKSETDVQVKFSWQMKDETYAISSLPLEKIRVRFSGDATMPTIKFMWTSGERPDRLETQYLMKNHVVYALVTVKEDDWPIQINLPLNTQ